MGTSYDTDVIAWANEQAALLRAGKFDAIDVPNIVDEIESVAHEAERWFGKRLASLMYHMLKWHYQTAWRCEYWRSVIGGKRQSVAYCLHETPSLRNMFEDEEWLTLVWYDASGGLRDETGLEFPEHCPWSVAQMLDDGFFPD